MYFFTQSGVKDASSFAQVATFFIDKFPAAFGASATYFNAKQNSSDTQYIRIDVAKSVVYSFEDGNQHAQSFDHFQVETEELIYPWQSLVAEFGGALGLFLGFSFMTVWDSVLELRYLTFLTNV